MQEYWHSLTVRERSLISVGAIMLGLTIAYFLIARPLLQYKADSERAYASAEATFETIQRHAAELKIHTQSSQSLKPQVQPATSLRVAVSNAARQASVTVSRLQPSEDGALTIWAEGVQSAQMYQWLRQLAQERGIGPSNVLVQKATDGNSLRVQFRFEEGSP